MSRSGQRQDASYGLVDLQEIGLPLLDESKRPAIGETSRAHPPVGRRHRTVRRVRLRDHRVPPRVPGSAEELPRLPLREWNNKAAGIVSYGGALGARAAEALRLVCGELRSRTWRSGAAVALHRLRGDGDFQPADRHVDDLNGSRPGRRVGRGAQAAAYRLTTGLACETVCRVRGARSRHTSAAMESRRHCHLRADGHRRHRSPLVRRRRRRGPPRRPRRDLAGVARRGASQPAVIEVLAEDADTAHYGVSTGLARSRLSTSR